MPFRVFFFFHFLCFSLQISSNMTSIHPHYVPPLIVVQFNCIFFIWMFDLNPTDLMLCRQNSFFRYILVLFDIITWIFLRHRIIQKPKKRNKISIDRNPYHHLMFGISIEENIKIYIFYISIIKSIDLCMNGTNTQSFFFVNPIGCSLNLNGWHNIHHLAIYINDNLKCSYGQSEW